MDLLLLLLLLLAFILLIIVSVLYLELRKLRQDLSSNRDMCGDRLYFRTMCLERRLEELDKRF